MLNTPLKLPCGAVIKNRIVKSAMSENLAAANHAPGDGHVNLYRTWSEGNVGIVITGNVMIDASALGEPGNVVTNRRYAKSFERWAAAGSANETHLWMQLNHPGKQSPRFLSKQPVAPSAIAFPKPMNRMFNTPRALTSDEIDHLIACFADAALLAKNTGFAGVQIHAAHGYLLSQFLSPLHNQRDDKWGGVLENRMRMLLEVVRHMRVAVGSKFPIGVKLNSADFQRGGFTESESIIVVEQLSRAGVDLIEISGGTYENPKMMDGRVKNNRSAKREAYFLDYCEKVRKKVTTPLLLTGGFRTHDGMKEALTTQSCDMIGVARAFALDPKFMDKIQSGNVYESPVKPLTTGIKRLDQLFPLEIIWYTLQLRRMAKNKLPNPSASVLGAIVQTLMTYGIQNIRRVRSS